MTEDFWRHRSSMMRCTTCMWYVPKITPEKDHNLGRCRKHAPTMDGYPVVFPEEPGCGDHKLDENAVPLREEVE